MHGQSYRIHRYLHVVTKSQKREMNRPCRVPEANDRPSEMVSQGAHRQYNLPAPPPGMPWQLIKAQTDHEIPRPVDRTARNVCWRLQIDYKIVRNPAYSPCPTGGLFPRGSGQDYKLKNWMEPLGGKNEGLCAVVHLFFFPFTDEPQNDANHKQPRRHQSEIVKINIKRIKIEIMFSLSNTFLESHNYHLSAH